MNITIMLETLAGSIETRERSDGERYTTIVESAPRWVHNLVYRAHRGEDPSDDVVRAVRAFARYFRGIDVTKLDDESLRKWAEQKRWGGTTEWCWAIAHEVVRALTEYART